MVAVGFAILILGVALMQGVPMVRAARWTRRTVLAVSAGIAGGALIPLRVAAKKRKPLAGVYSDTYSNLY